MHFTFSLKQIKAPMSSPNTLCSRDINNENIRLSAKGFRLIILDNFEMSLFDCSCHEICQDFSLFEIL